MNIQQIIRLAAEQIKSDAMTDMTIETKDHGFFNGHYVELVVTDADLDSIALNWMESNVLLQAFQGNEESYAAYFNLFDTNTLKDAIDKHFLQLEVAFEDVMRYASEHDDSVIFPCKDKEGKVVYEITLDDLNIQQLTDVARVYLDLKSSAVHCAEQEKPKDFLVDAAFGIYRNFYYYPDGCDLAFVQKLGHELAGYMGEMEPFSDSETEV